MKKYMFFFASFLFLINSQEKKRGKSKIFINQYIDF
jgi:hypothetical protein